MILHEEKRFMKGNVKKKKKKKNAVAFRERIYFLAFIIFYKEKRVR